MVSSKNASRKLIKDNTPLSIQGNEKPHFEEVGPFVYQQFINMTNIEFSQDGSEITHSVYTEFYFNESLSIGSDDIHVLVPNVPLFGMTKLMAKDLGIRKWGAKELLQTYKDDPYKGVDTKPFMNVSVKQLLWGYPSAIMTLKRDINNPPDCVQEKEDYDDPFSGKDALEFSK